MCPSARCGHDMTLMAEGHDGRAPFEWWWCEPPDGCGCLVEHTAQADTEPQPDLFGGRS
jgi:hypothetical protein